jgi:outer membrane biogenesis lipoprotein LolB
MKRLFSFMAIIAIVFASNCSRIPENNDPVIGIWYRLEIQTQSETSKQSVRQEWIFNDAYLGRYHRYNGSQLEFKTDFKWERADGNYTISYPGTDMTENVVSLKSSPDGQLLEDAQGNILAKRE